MKSYRSAMAFCVVAVLLATSAPSLADTVQPATVQAPAAATAAQAKAEPPAHGYAEREATSAPAVEKFQGGGSSIYIGGTTVVIVLLVIIVILLI